MYGQTAQMSISTCIDVVSRLIGAGLTMAMSWEAAAIIIDAASTISGSMRGASVCGEKGSFKEGISTFLAVQVCSIADMESLIREARECKVGLAID
jgi:hypothetical protein